MAANTYAGRPALGEHTAEVLAELGCDQAAMKELAHVIQL